MIGSLIALTLAGIGVVESAKEVMNKYEEKKYNKWIESLSEKELLIELAKYDN